MKNIVLIGALFLSVAHAGADRANSIVWLKLSMNIEYTDIYATCSSIPGSSFAPKLYLAAEINEQQQILRAFFRKSTSNLFGKSYEIPKQLIDRIAIFVDSNDSTWLKSFVLDEAALRWVLEPQPSYSLECGPRTALATLDPTDVTFEFESNAVPMTGGPSNSIRFSGTTAEKSPSSYQISLGFIQTRANPRN